LDAYPFKDLIADVTVVGGKPAVVDKGGNISYVDSLHMRENFSDGMAMFQHGESWGFVNETGETVIEPQYDSVEQFSEGLACVRLGMKKGFIDKQGNIVIKPQYDNARPFSEGLAPVRLVVQ
jgi:hypothetical protein